jgi:hypothetical protein
MTTDDTHKPWMHPEWSDWCKGLHFMANQIRDGKLRTQVIEETLKYIDDNQLEFTKSNVTLYYPWLERRIGEESHQLD